MSDDLAPPAPPEQLVPKGHFDAHVVDRDRVAELRWLWGQVKAHVFEVYPFCQRVEVHLGVAYNDWCYPFEMDVTIDEEGLSDESEDRGVYLSRVRDYVTDATVTRLPAARSELFFSPFEGEDPVLPAGAARYRAPLMVAESLFGALLHDLEEAYFLRLFGLAARVTFTTAEVVIDDEYDIEQVVSRGEWDWGGFRGVRRG